VLRYCQMFYNVTNPGMTVQQGDILVSSWQLVSLLQHCHICCETNFTGDTFFCLALELSHYIQHILYVSVASNGYYYFKYI